MRLTIRFRSTDLVTIPHVQAVKVVGPDTLEISEVDRRCETCGNTWHSEEVPVSHCLNCGSLRVAIV